jgi:hypothetical protein
LRVRSVSRLCAAEPCSVAWITIATGRRASKFGDGTHSASALRGACGAWAQAASSTQVAAMNVRRSIFMRALQRLRLQLASAPQKSGRRCRRPPTIPCGLPW